MRDAWVLMLRAATAMGIPPAAFWRLAVREWRALTADETALGRAEFEALARTFPDRMR